MKVLIFSSSNPEATVRRGNGSSVSRLRSFHVAAILALAIAGASAQSVSSFSPTNGIPGTPVTVNGASFGVVTNVTFNGASCIFETVSASKIIATVPLGATYGKIAVNGLASSPSFIVAPRIDSIAPYKVRTNMAGALINGANLTNAASVKLNGTNLTFTVLSASQIQFTVPANAVTGPLTI
ncbi:MAG TPA: IPT/TIG domain-containing protein, partial [Roseimicrobium sp.]|nr:IPT/TIG domain-containing protein [Roseimicrobium sp.]